MPYSFETRRIKLPVDKDARRKLTEADKDRIRNLYKFGRTIRSIAREYKSQCCRRTIQFVIFPERLKTVNYPGHWEKYYKKEGHREAMQKYRRRKQKIISA